MSMIGHFRAVDDSLIDTVLSSPDLIHGVVHPDDEEEGSEHLDVDKAWHTIHYVLTVDTWDEGSPVGFILSGGSSVGEEDVGYGPVRAFRSQEVKEISAAVSMIDDGTFRQRFSVEKLKEADIYPSFGHASDDEEIPYFMDYFQQLRSFLQKAAAQEKGLLIYID